MLMHRAYLWIVTAVLEGGTAVALLFVPSAPLALLLGVTQAAPEALFVSRVAGAALLAIAVACWLARGDRGSSAGLGLLIGVLLYDAAAAGLLAYAGTALNMAGAVLWPAVAVHAVLAAWCVACLWAGPQSALRRDWNPSGPEKVGPTSKGE
jgi:hypothetical protein